MTDLPHWTDPMFKSLYSRKHRKEREEGTCSRCFRKKVCKKNISICEKCRIEIQGWKDAHSDK